MGSYSKQYKKARKLVESDTDDDKYLDNEESEQEEQEEDDGDDNDSEEEQDDIGEEGESEEGPTDDGDDSEEEGPKDEEENGMGENGWTNESNKDAEMEELEKEYMDLRNQEQDILKNLKHHKDEDLLKGQAVKNQKSLWDKVLELRFLLQKPFSNSNRLPQEPFRSSFCDEDKAVRVAYLDMINSSKKTLDSILELQEALLENNPSIAQSLDGNSEKPSNLLKPLQNLDESTDEEWSKISQMHARIAPFRDKSINKWQRKTQVTTGAAAMRSKLQAFNQDISDQVATYMRDPSRMIKQMQIRRSTIGVFGTVLEAKDEAKREEVDADVDPELIDDSEFYQQLLKEFFESIDPTSSEATFYALKRLQKKKRKIVDRRASKSRKIRYNVHEKLVNFMAPQPMNVPSMAPKLFENLFGLKTRDR